MIHEFSFGNFRSFKDINTLNLTAAKIDDLNNEAVINGRKKILKSKAIYGANASGKSNIIKALISFVRIVRYTKDTNIWDLAESFELSTETENEPTFFQLIFEYENVIYRYGFEVTPQKIVNEWLFGKPKTREAHYFIREGNNIVKINKEFYHEGYTRLSVFKKTNAATEDNLLDDKTLFLSAMAFLNAKLSKNIISYIRNIYSISGLRNNVLHEISKKVLKSTQKRGVVEFMKFADVDIDDIHVVETSEGDEVIYSEHKKYNTNKNKVESRNFNFLSKESEGTIKMLEIAPILMAALDRGVPILIDEFDARFHPLITKAIIQLYNSSVNKKSQLIFVTHDTNLLSSDLLRRDQIDFVEKDKYGASHICTLVEYKDVRKNSSFEKDYIKGKYGAIPFVGDFSQLLNSESNA